MPRKKNHSVKDTGTLIKSVSKPFELYYTLNKYDRNLRDYSDKLKKNYSREYDELAANVKHRLSYEAYRESKFDAPYRKRRISAVVDYAMATADAYDEKYPDICVEDELIKFCSTFASTPPDVMDKRDFMSLAAALFILDSVVKSGNYPDAVFFIPHDEQIHTVSLPYDFQDSGFTNDVIQGVLFLIQNRHGSVDTFYSPETADITDGTDKFCEYRKYAVEPEGTDVMTLFEQTEGVCAEQYYNTAEQMSLQEKYYALISFIRPEIIERAIKRFRDKSMELLDIVFEQACEFRKKCIDVAEKAKPMISDMDRTDKRLKEMRKDFKSRAGKLLKSLNKAGMADPVFGSAPFTADSDLSLVKDMNTMIDKFTDLNKKISELTEDLFNLEMQLNLQYQEISYGFIENLRKTANERVREFKINNPYEMIFAFLYLIDCGDSLPWISHIMECICGYAVQQLPWNEKENYVLDDLIDEKIISCDESYNDTEFLPPLHSRFCEDDDQYYEEEYALKYNDAFLWVRDDLKLQKDDLLPYNLAQVIYSDSNIVPPRYAEMQYESVTAFVKSGFTKKQAEIIKYYKCFAETNRNKYGFEKVLRTENRIRERDIKNTAALSSDELNRMITAKNEEIESLKKKLYSSEKQISDLTKKIDTMHENAATENQELIELRELIYKIQNSSVEEESTVQESDITFPYRASARIVVFGGHATWLKVIVKLLPNVRFIDPYADPDVNAIRNADVVWLQTNAMPHNKYNKIMEIVRMKKIPVKYFAYASAEKSALQLAEYDRQEMNK